MFRKYALIAVAVIVTAAWSGIARATDGNGNGNNNVHGSIAQNGVPSFVNQLVPGVVTRVSPSLVPKGGKGDWPGGATVRRTYSAKAYPACFSASGAWSGPDDWSGYAHLNGWLSWCSNGFWITYATGGEYPTTSGYYNLSYHNGAWWSGGCVGCQTIQMKDYMIWSWHAPLIGYDRSGTTWLTQTGTYYGSYSN